MTKTELRKALGWAIAREHGFKVAGVSLNDLVEIALKRGLQARPDLLEEKQ